MGRRDWDYVNLPKLLVKRLDQFLETPRAKSTGMSSKSELLRHIINDYLDEQERFYNNLQSIHDFILQMRERDHMVITFNEEPQFEEILHGFLERGLKHEQVNLLFISKDEESRFVEVLSKGTSDIDTLFNSQDIIILQADECYIDGAFSMELVSKKLSHAAELVKKKGKSGINAIGTLPGKLVRQGKYEEALRIERGFHETVQRFEVPLTVICMYNSLPGEAQDRFLQCHDLVIKHAVTERESGLL